MLRAALYPVALAAALVLSSLPGTAANAQPIDLKPGSQTTGSFGDGSTSTPGVQGEATPLIPDPGYVYVQPVVPMITRSLLPGHWTLHGAKSVWVPPETVLRQVQTAALIQGRYVWRNGAFVWVPTHYDNGY